MTKQEQAQKKITKDWEEINAFLLTLEPQKLINQSYAIAHYSMVDESLGEEGWFEDLEEEEAEAIINYKGNFCLLVTLTFFNYNHTEYYNFFEGESFLEIFRNVLEYNMGDIYTVKGSLKNG